MGTYGRVGLAREAVACFLAQTAASRATLLIYNQHPAPISFSHPRVRVVNEPIRYPALRQVKRRMHELARPDAEFIHWWDDDDLYLPWHLEDCLDHIRDAVAWKPASSWFWQHDGEISRTRNQFEGSWMFRTEFLAAAPLDTHPDYSDHPVIMQAMESGQVATTEFGDRTSYIYRWATGAPHVSDFVDLRSPGSQATALDEWRARSGDTADAASFSPADLTPRWREFLAAIRNRVSDRDYAFICAGLAEAGWGREALSASNGQG